MTDAERRRLLIDWLQVACEDIQRLLINDHLFWELQRIIEQNDKFLSASGLFTEFIADTYSQSAAIGIRRHAKANRDSISLVRFLQEVRDHPQTVSRAHYMSHYEGKQNWQVKIGQDDFDDVAGQGSSHISSDLPERQISEIRQVAAGLEHYVDRRVAHYDKRDLARPIPKFSEVSDALKVLEGVVLLYWRFLKGAAMNTMLPTIQYDWKDIFRFAWQPNKLTMQSTQELN